MTLNLHKALEESRKEYKEHAYSKGKRMAARITAPIRYQSQNLLKWRNIHAFQVFWASRCFSSTTKSSDPLSDAARGNALAMRSPEAPWPVAAPWPTMLLALEDRDNASPVMVSDICLVLNRSQVASRRGKTKSEPETNHSRAAKASLYWTRRIWHANDSALTSTARRQTEKDQGGGSIGINILIAIRWQAKPRVREGGASWSASWSGWTPVGESNYSASYSQIRQASDLLRCAGQRLLVWHYAAKSSRWHCVAGLGLGASERGIGTLEVSSRLGQGKKNEG